MPRGRHKNNHYMKQFSTCSARALLPKSSASASGPAAPAHVLAPAPVEPCPSLHRAKPYDRKLPRAQHNHIEATTATAAHIPAATVPPAFNISPAVTPSPSVPFLDIETQRVTGLVTTPVSQFQQLTPPLYPLASAFPPMYPWTPILSGSDQVFFYTADSVVPSRQASPAESDATLAWNSVLPLLPTPVLSPLEQQGAMNFLPVGPRPTEGLPFPAQSFFPASPFNELYATFADDSTLAKMEANCYSLPLDETGLFLPAIGSVPSEAESDGYASSVSNCDCCFDFSGYGAVPSSVELANVPATGAQMM